MISVYRELKSEETETTELDVHLEACAACREVLASYTRIGEQMRSAPVFTPQQDMHAKLMKVLADEQLKFLQKSAPGTVTTPEFLKPYLQERAEETQSQDDIAAFSTAETGPLPFIPARHKRRSLRVGQFGVLGLAAAVLILIMMGGLTSLLMLERNNPTSIARTSNSVNRPTEVDQKIYTTATLYPNVTSALPIGNSVYYTAYGDGANSNSWMLMQFDRGTQASKALLDSPSSDPLIVLSVSHSWLVWLQYSNSPIIGHADLPNGNDSYSPQRSWSLHYLSLLPQTQNASSPQVQPQPKKSQNEQKKTTPLKQSLPLINDPTLANLPTAFLLSEGTFDTDTAPAWVSTPIQGSLLLGDSDTLLVTQIDQKGISHLVSYQLGQTGKTARGQQLATAPAGHVFAWPTATSTGLQMYWADEWVAADGVLHSNVWQRQTSEQTLRHRGHLEEVNTYTQQVFLGDGMSFQPQVVSDTLFLLSTSEIKVEGQNAVAPNGTPFPTSATDTLVHFTPRTDPGVYAAPADASIHGTLFLIPLSGLAIGTESMLGTVGQSTGYQAGSNYVIWQDSTGYQMYDVTRQSDVVINDTLNAASLLAVNGNTTLWFSANSMNAAPSKLTLMTFSWSN